MDIVLPTLLFLLAMYGVYKVVTWALGGNDGVIIGNVVDPNEKGQ